LSPGGFVFGQKESAETCFHAVAIQHMPGESSIKFMRRKRAKRAIHSQSERTYI